MKPPANELRVQTLQRLAETSLDVLIIGAGITGSGIARDAAMRGLSTGLVDRYDFAFGTSSRSSRLLHGGLRYLEQGRIGLVREASLEKKTIRAIAPHLAQPMGFTFPAYQHGGRPLWQLRCGVKLYDLLCNGRNFAPSRGFNRSETLHELPTLNPKGLLGSVHYSDALTNDARLVLDTLHSARRHGATVTNYVRFLNATRRDDHWQCELVDSLTGEELRIRAHTLVNATGPWSPQIPHSVVKLRLTKGIHIVVNRERLPVTNAVVITEGKRILFIIPWGERVIIGTTDTDYHAAPETVQVSPDDISYLLKTVNTAFPQLDLRSDEIISSWAGLRPLAANPDGSPSDVSRSHQIFAPKPGWWDVTGGKLTTYRLMAEQVVDRIAKHLNRSVSDCRTDSELLIPLGTDRAYSGITPPPCTRKAVAHYVLHEWAIHLDDVMIRRSGWHYYHPDAAQLAEKVTTWMSELLNWSPAKAHQELAHYLSAKGNPPPHITDASMTPKLVESKIH